MKRRFAQIALIAALVLALAATATAANVEYTRPVLSVQRVDASFSASTTPNTTVETISAVDPARTIIVPVSTQNYSISQNMFVGWALTSSTGVTFYYYAGGAQTIPVSVYVVELANKPKSIQIIEGQADGSTSTINAVNTSRAFMICSWLFQYLNYQAKIDLTSSTEVTWTHTGDLIADQYGRLRAIVVDP